MRNNFTRNIIDSFSSDIGIKTYKKYYSTVSHKHCMPRRYQAL
jgi:hypothetical protein